MPVVLGIDEQPTYRRHLQRLGGGLRAHLSYGRGQQTPLQGFPRHTQCGGESPTVLSSSSVT